MTKTRILWIDDNRAGHMYLFGELMDKYDVDITCPNTNEYALERAKDRWEIVFYDIGLGNSKWGTDLPAARKIRELVSPAPFIGITYNSLCYYDDFKDSFDDLVQSFQFHLDDFVRLAEKHNVELTKKE